MHHLALRPRMPVFADMEKDFSNDLCQKMENKATQRDSYAAFVTSVVNCHT